MRELGLFALPIAWWLVRTVGVSLIGLFGVYGLLIEPSGTKRQQAWGMAIFLAALVAFITVTLPAIRE